MGVIPQGVIDNWYKQYDENSPLWSEYEGFGPEIAQYVRDLAEKDRAIIESMCLAGRTPPEGKPEYLATCGAPLAGKSTILDQFIHAYDEAMNIPHEKSNKDYVLVDPDAYGMRFMSNLYYGFLLSPLAISTVEDYSIAQKRAYDIARPASNYITLEILNKAAEMGCNIAHGTTMTSPHIKGLLKGVKSAGYEITLLLCGAEDQMRVDGQEYRSGKQGNYQATLHDVYYKGIDFPKRMQDYFEMADTIMMYWRNHYLLNAVAGAEYCEGACAIRNGDAYKGFTEYYQASRAALAASEEKIVLPSFADIERIYAQRFGVTPSAKMDFQKYGM